MAGPEKMDAEFARLVSEGEAFMKDFHESFRYRWYIYSPLNSAYSRWKKACLKAVEEAFGEKSRYYLRLSAAENDHRGNAPNSVFIFFLDTVKSAQGDLKAVPEAVIPAVLEPDLMNDFLERAESLVRKGHFVSAATLAGAVLEDALRRFCEMNDIFCAENAVLENANDKLLQAGVYDAAMHRETAKWISLKRTAEL
jgi:hypothetical protein